MHTSYRIYPVTMQSLPVCHPTRATSSAVAVLELIRRKDPRELQLPGTYELAPVALLPPDLSPNSIPTHSLSHAKEKNPPDLPTIL
jgi:hypothetical protein